MLIVFAGLPGAGKTTLARKLAQRLAAVYLRIDTVEQAMAQSSLRIDPAEDAGYAVGYAVAADNLRLGRIVISDSVNPIELTRTAWLTVARAVGCPVVEVEVACSNPVEHQRPVEERTADIEGHRLPTWQNVVDREYHPWARDHIVVDTAGRTVEQCIDEIVAELPASPVAEVDRG